jgi:hypothetical protein
MNKVHLEYEQCRCSKIRKEVTVTSMVIEDPGPDATPYLTVKQAFDCDQKKSCGVLIILGKKRQLNWADCTHPDLTEVSGSDGG